MKFLNLIINNPYKIFISIFIISCLGINGIQNFKLDASSDALIIEDDKSLKVYRESAEIFGNNDFLFVVLDIEDKIFTKDTINYISKLKNDLSEIEGIESVLSIIDAPIFFQPSVGLTEVADNLKYLTDVDIDLNAAKEEFLENPIYQNLILNSDGSITALQLILEDNKELNDLINKRYELKEANNLYEYDLVNEKISLLNQIESKKNELRIKKIRSIIDSNKEQGTIYLGGPSMIAVDIMSFINDDLIKFGAGVAIVFALMLFLFFKSINLVFISLSNAFLATYLTAAFLGYMEWKITVVSSNFIALLLILTISISVHLIVRLQELSTKMKPIDAVRESVNQMFIPCFFAALTTCVAFLSLITGDLKPVIEFGKMMSVGITFALLLTFLLIPSYLLIFKKFNVDNSTKSSKLNNYLANYSLSMNLSRYLFLGLFLVFVFGITHIRVENKFIDYFDQSTEIYKGMDLIDNELGGTAPLDIVIRKPNEEFNDDLVIDDDIFDDDLFEDDSSTASGYWWNIYSLNKLESIHDYIESQEEVGKVLSVASGLKLARKINDDKDLNDLELALLRSVLPEDIRDSLLYSYINEDDSVVRISARVIESKDNLSRNNFLINLRVALIEKFNLEESQFDITGLVVLYNNMLQSLFSSLLNSLIIVFTVIGLMFLLIFKSVKAMIIGLIPNIFVASSVIGMFGLLKIPLDIMTITVASISVGMAVDNTLHYMYRLKKELKQSNYDYEVSILNTHMSIGLAIRYTAITISAGFLILMLSNFKPTILFGVFTSFALLTSFIISLTLLPNLLLRFKLFNK